MLVLCYKRRKKHICLIGCVPFDTWPNVCYLSIALLFYIYLLHVHEIVIEIMIFVYVRARETQQRTPIRLSVCSFICSFWVACTILPWVTCALWDGVCVHMNEMDLMNDRVCQIWTNQQQREKNKIWSKPRREGILWKKESINAFKHRGQLRPNNWTRPWYPANIHFGSDD